MFRSKQTFGKYRVVRKLAEGGFAVVYKAYDTVEGVDVALKVPHKHLIDAESMEDFRKEVRLTAKLDHPNILHIKNAMFIDGMFVIAYPLGTGTLQERLGRRQTLKATLDLTEQILEALAFAHRSKVIHCDVKPENFILFPNGRIRLTDFGIAKFTHRTILQGSGSGTVGYVAPEQAMGKPSFRSDVFSAGLILYQMLTGKLPTWPFEWPLEGYEKLRGKCPPEFIRFLRKSLEVDARKRFSDADQMYDVFLRLKAKTLSHATRKRRKKRKKDGKWRDLRIQEFRRKFGKVLEAHLECRKCGKPISERMTYCPWCSTKRSKYRGETKFPMRCRRCGNGMKADWKYCPSCYGGAYQPDVSRTYSDRRYEAKCSNRNCKRKDLMPFMHYCPWCNTKVRKKWKLPNVDEKCPRCQWAVVPEFWDHCPWCARTFKR